MAVLIGSGTLLLFLTLAVNAIALLVPYWVDSTGDGVTDTLGLWGTCTCSWYYNSYDSIKNSTLPDWAQAAQWMYAIALVLMVIAALITFLAGCCSNKSTSHAYTAAGSFLLIGALLVAASVVVFGVKGNADGGIKLNGVPKFMWGMWMGAAGFVLALITAIVFLIQHRRERHQFAH